MKKYVLIMLVILALSFSTMVSAANFDEFTISLENILTQDVVEIQAVSAPDFGGVAVLSVNLSEQVVVDNNTILPADIGLEMETIVESYNIKDFTQITDIDGSRGGSLPIAGLF